MEGESLRDLVMLGTMEFQFRVHKSGCCRLHNFNFGNAVEQDAPDQNEVASPDQNEAIQIKTRYKVNIEKLNNSIHKVSYALFEGCQKSGDVLDIDGIATDHC